jgi:hypothetical protein
MASGFTDGVWLRKPDRELKLPKTRLERSRCAADAFACAGRAVEAMI